MDDLWDDRDDTLMADLLQRASKKRSKFDILQYLPEGERKKATPIDSGEKLIVCLSKLVDDLFDLGEPTKGLRAHMIYVATMHSEGIYDVRALVAYDLAIREQADKKVVLSGEDPFVGVDTALSNFHLGYAGTKHARGLSQNQSNSVNQSGRGRGRGRGTFSRQQGFTGWRKIAAEKGCCFGFSAGRHCDGCGFKHQCAHCNATDHGMLKCKQHDAASYSG